MITMLCLFDKKIPGGLEFKEMTRPPYSLVSIIRIILMHTLTVAGLYYYGWTWTAVGYAVVCYYLRHFAIAGFFHRYFSHRSFKTSRPFQFLMAGIGSMGGQKGPLSWATSHRLHHRYTEKPQDPHSPKVLGAPEAYIGWVLRKDALHTDLELMKDFAVFPEIVWINKFHYLWPMIFLAITALIGAKIESIPGLHTSMMQIILWGFFVSTLANAHSAMIVNTLCHIFGSRPYKTRDESTNLWWLLPLSTGENWHNNHHAFPKMAASGLKWWEFDPIYWGIKGLEKMGLVWDVIDKSYLERYQDAGEEK
jgi:stearoyl-CoA desaturase (delta-9 desaturase)